MAKNLFTGVTRNFAATNQMRYKNAYKRRLQDRCIMDDLCNGNPENIKSFIGKGKGSQVELYIPGTVKVRDTTVDGGIVYQQVTDASETFGVNNECYWAIKQRPEDKEFMPWDPMSTYFTNATDEVARHIERRFGSDIPGKVLPVNKGHEAGATYRNFDLGECAQDHAVVLYKTQRQCDEAKSVQHRDVCFDFLIKIANTIRQGEGLSGGHINMVIPSPVKHHLQTSELKYGGLMGQRNIDLGVGERGGRTDVKFLGTLDDSIGIIQHDMMFHEQVKTYVKNGVKHTIYPIFAMMPDACAYINEMLIRDDNMKDVGNWDLHYRAKHLYDWPVLFPQMMAMAYVELAEPDFVAA